MVGLPNREQRFLLDEVATVYLNEGQWPGWAWLEETAERQSLNAAEIVATFPRVFSVGYSYLSPIRPTMPAPTDRIAVTVWGLSYVERARTLVDAFVNLLDALGTIRAGIKLDPFSDSRPIVTRAQVMEGRLPSPVWEARLMPLLTKEPATWSCVPTPSWESWETLQLTPELRRFAGVSSFDDYMERMGSYMTPPQSAPSRQSHSPFTLPASVDYLDVVWTLRFGQPLVVPPGVERSARLAFDASGPDEADTRLSALSELLKGLRVPGVPGIDGHPLARLGPFLESHLPTESHSCLQDAVGILDAARQLRAGGQHVGARAKTVEAHHRLGLSYPMADWSLGWEQIQVAVAEAFDAIRDEIQASGPPSE